MEDMHLVGYGGVQHLASQLFLSDRDTEAMAANELDVDELPVIHAAVSNTCPAVPARRRRAAPGARPGILPATLLAVP